MKFKTQYIAGAFRIIVKKFNLRDRVKFKSFFQYIGSKCNFCISQGSLLVLGSKNYFTENVYIGVHDNGRLDIGENNFFNRNIIIECLNSISIGNNNLFGPNIVIVDHDHEFEDSDELICKQGYKKGKIIIGSDIWVGANVTICKDVKIADHIVVGANSVVTHDLIEPAVYAGCPAKKVRKVQHID